MQVFKMTCVKLFISELLITQEEQSQMSVSGELIKFNGFLCIY